MKITKSFFFFTQIKKNYLNEFYNYLRITYEMKLT